MEMARYKLEMQRRQARECTNQLKEYYYSRNVHPTSITNGWHTAVATDNDMFCGEVEVMVSENKVTQVKPTDKIRVVSSHEIDKGKTMIRIGNGVEIGYLELYFLE